jgi:methionyl aminopeptidase
MSIQTDEELQGLKRVGGIVALALEEMRKHLKAGMTTRELDEIGQRFLRKHKARSAPKLTYNFPGATCISINDEVAHGIPGDRAIQPGDLVNIDVSAELNGLFADTGATFPVSPVSDLQRRLCAAARRALRKAVAVVRTDAKFNRIGRIIEDEAHESGFEVIHNLYGHGVGRGLHEEPEEVANFYDVQDQRQMTEGLVFTIEPMLTTGARLAVEDRNGWTMRTEDGSLIVQYEHTVVATKRGALLLTQV